MIVPTARRIKTSVFRRFYVERLNTCEAFAVKLDDLIGSAGQMKRDGKTVPHFHSMLEGLEKNAFINFAVNL